VQVIGREEMTVITDPSSAVGEISLVNRALIAAANLKSLNRYASGGLLKMWPLASSRPC
jgi:hypothetical protein